MESASKRLYEVLELSKWSRHSVTVIRDRTLSLGTSTFFILDISRLQFSALTRDWKKIKEEKKKVIIRKYLDY